MVDDSLGIAVLSSELANANPSSHLTRIAAAVIFHFFNCN